MEFCVSCILFLLLCYRGKEKLTVGLQQSIALPEGTALTALIHSGGCFYSSSCQVFLSTLRLFKPNRDSSTQTCKITKEGRKNREKKKKELLQQQPCHCPSVFSGREWLVSISVGSNHGRDRMFGFREQAVSLYCQSKHLQLQITTSFAVYKACYARIRCKDALHSDKRGQCHYPAFVNSVTVLKTLVQYLPSSKMSNACHFVNLDASVTRKTVLSRQQVSFNSQGLASKEVSKCY